MRAITRTAATTVLLAAVAGDGIAQDRAPEWRLSAEPILAVGRTDGAPEEMFTRIAGAIRLADGRYVVADGEELRVSVYDAAGGLETFFGREGKGPGELSSLRGLWSAGGDTIAVWDSRAQRITYFRTDGSVVRTIVPAYASDRPPTVGGMLDVFVGSLSDGGVALGWLGGSRTPSGVAADRLAFGVFGRDGGFVRMQGEGTGMERIYEPGVGGGPHAFSPFAWAATVGDTVAFTDGSDGAVRFFAPDGGARSVTVAGPTRSLDDAWRIVEATLEDSEAAPFVRELVRRSDRSVGTVPRHARMLADDEGRLWLKDFDPATDPVPLRGTPFVTGGAWRIVDTRGNLIARLAMPADVAPLAVEDGFLLGVARDALDVERFVVYRLR